MRPASVNKILKEDIMTSVSIQVPDELASVGAVVLKACEDIKAKASLSQDAADLIPGLLSALANLSALQVDLSVPGCRAYLAYVVESCVEVFVAAPAAVAVAAPVA